MKLTLSLFSETPYDAVPNIAINAHPMNLLKSYGNDLA